MENNSSKPYYLKMRILEGIRSGEYPVGGALPSTRKLSEMYSVGKFTVAQALNSLQELGVVDIAHGKTTKVIRCPAKYKIPLLFWGDSLNEKGLWGAFWDGINEEILLHPEYDVELCQMKSMQLDLPLAVDGENTKGVLLLASSQPQYSEQLKKRNLPFLHVYDFVEEADESVVGSDFEEAYEELAASFRAAGCVEVVYVGLGDRHGVNAEKEHTFLAACAKNGYGPKQLHLIQNNWSISDAYTPLVKLLKNGKTPTALMLGSDELATMAIRAVFDAGREISRDLFLASSDNLPLSEFQIPSLTTVELNRTEIGRRAVRTLLRMIDGEHPRKKSRIKGCVVYRESLQK